MPDLFDPPEAKRPTKLGAELRGALEAALRFVSREEPIPESALAPNVRRWLIIREAELRDAMRPGDRSEIGQALLTFVDMRGGFKPGSAAEAAFFNQLRAADLSEVPLWALVETVRAYRRGEIGAGVIRPTAGQLRKQAEERAAPFFAELQDVAKVLAAPIVPEPTQEDIGRRRELARRMRELGARLAASPGYAGSQPLSHNATTP